jgi:tRNA-2-methylthio-N6-dimethylallyladenosine synthase
MNKYVGTVQKVLVEGESRTNKDVLTGRTWSGRIVNFEGPKELIGKEIEVKIVSQHVWYLKGQI